MKTGNKTCFLATLLILFFHISANAQSFFNLGFEYKLNDQTLINWRIQNVRVSIDSLNQIEGDYALEVVRNAEDSVSPLGIVYQQANNLYHLKGKKINLNTKIKVDFEGDEGAASAFIQAIYFTNPEKNKVVLDQDVKNKKGWIESSTSYEVDDEHIPDVISAGILFAGQGKIYLDDFEIQLDDKPYQDFAFRKEPLNKKEREWLNKNTIPVSPEINDTKKLLKSVGNSRIVAIGEATHGSATIFDIKNKLSKILIEQGSFNILAIEDTPYWGEVLNQYIMGNTEKLPHLQMYAMHTNKIFLDFVEWLREYNKTAKKKVQIVGVDIAKENKEILAELDSKTQKEFSTMLSDMNNIITNAVDNWGKDYKYQYQAISFTKEEKELVENGVADINAWIEKNIQEENEKTILFLYTRNLIQILQLSKTIRDKMMADNIQWILGRKPEEKIIYLAHNSHVGSCIYSDNTPYFDLLVSKLPYFENNDFPNGSPYSGWYLKKYFGDDYYTIATCFYEGKDNPPTTGVIEVSKANPGSYEYLLNMAAISDYFLDIRSIKNSKKAEVKWLQNTMLLRSIGASYNPYYEFEIHNLTEEFDAVIFFKKSDPS